MKTAEIKGLSTSELKEKIEVEQNNLVRMKMNHAVSPIENPMQIRELRRTIAKLQTELRSRTLAETK